MNLFIKFYTMFDRSKCEVTTSKRFFAYVIDWFLGSLFTMLPMCILWLMWTKDMETMSRVNVLLIAGTLSYPQAYFAGLLSVAFALFYYVVVPWKIYPGQTCGKRAMGFKIVHLDDTAVTLKTLLIREVLGIMIIEGALYNVSGILHSLLSLLTNLNLVQLLMYIGLAISVVSCFIALKMESRRMLHDYLAKTKIVESDEEKAPNQSI